MSERTTRRRFLKQAGVASAAAALGGSGALARATGSLASHPSPGAAAPPTRRTKHLLFVAFAGGVRSRETIGTPANVPNLMRMAEAGFVLPDVHAENVGHYGATLSAFTGNVEYMGIRENEPGENPTVFERLRKDAGLAAGDVWLVASGGPQLRYLGSSRSDAYGPAWGATQLTSDGILSAEFRSALERFGSPRPPDEAREQRIRGLRAALDPDAGGAALPGRPGLGGEAADVLESLVLRELTGATSRLTGPAAGDLKALEIARTIFLGYRPRFLAVALFSADVAHRSYNDYVEVIRRRDEEIGKILDAVLVRPEFQDNTTILVAPEFGRDRDLNQRNGLDHGDNSDELTRVAAIGFGPDFRARARPKKPVRTIDLAPTMLHLLGATPPRDLQGRVLKDLLRS